MKVKIISGQKYYSLKYGEFVVDKYVNCYEVFIHFLDTGTKVVTSADQIRKCKVKDVNAPTRFGVGYLGEGMYRASENKKNTKAFSIWSAMLKRCYSGHPEFASYNGCTVCEEWHNFQNFAKWFYENHIDGFQLDKDFISFGNKVYGPEFCSFVPSEINSFMPRYEKSEAGSYGIAKLSTGFLVHQQENGISTFRQVYPSLQDASNALHSFKKEKAKSLALKWKNNLDYRVYENLIDFNVEHYINSR